MTNIAKVPALLIIFSMGSCTTAEEKDNTPAENKPDENKPVIHYDKYIVELDKNYKIFKVTFTSEITTGFTMEYNYFKDSIIKTNRSSPTNTDVTTYYLNSRGLADSCKTIFPYNNVTRTYFYYDSTGYLKTSIEKGGLGTTTRYEYMNGNLINAAFSPRLPPGIYYINYQYDSSINLINIETFNGSWLGVLNKNLILKKNDHTIDGVIQRTYYYVLNSMGLPEKRTSVPEWINHDTKMTSMVTSFEYKIIE